MVTLFINILDGKNCLPENKLIWETKEFFENITFDFKCIGISKRFKTIISEEAVRSITFSSNFAKDSFGIINLLNYIELINEKNTLIVAIVPFNSGRAFPHIARVPLDFSAQFIFVLSSIPLIEVVVGKITDSLELSEQKTPDWANLNPINAFY